MMNLGNKIRELRKARGLTQEQFASMLSISPQAVSKWEMGGGYPDMTMIPVLANFFDVSLDVLFDFDVSKKAQKIEDILEEAGRYFWNNFDRAKQIFTDGIKEFPSAEKLKSELLSLYECHIRSYGRTELIDEAIEMAKRLVFELTDVFAVCSAKDSLISLYMMQDKYEEAKEVVDGLPYMYPYMLNDRMRCASYHLRGEDRLAGAKMWKVLEEQELFIACDLEGRGYFEIGAYENALKSFVECKDVIERFMIAGKTGYDAYPIGGTHANHLCCYVGIAGCQFKLGRTQECEDALTAARRIVDTTYENDGDGRAALRKTFAKAYREFGLEEYAAL